MISKGSGIPRAQLREQNFRDLISGRVQPKFLSLSSNDDTTSKSKRTKAVYDLTIYTKKGTLRINQSPLDVSYKSKTHVKVRATGEIVSRADWKLRERNRLYQLRIDTMKCVRCAKRREHPDVITCKSCTERSRVLYNKKVAK